MYSALLYTVEDMSNATGGSSIARSLTPSSDRVFDIVTEKGALELLHAIHISALDLDAKNTLRDSIFSFKSEANAVVTQDLQTVFSSHGFALNTDAHEGDASAAPKEQQQQAAKEPEKVLNRLGMTRKRPSFLAVSPVVPANDGAAKVPVAPELSETKVEPVEEEKPAAKQEVSEVLPSAEVKAEPEVVTADDTTLSFVPESVAQAQEIPQPEAAQTEEVPTPVQSVGEAAAEKAAVPEATEAEVAEQADDDAVAPAPEAAERIKEIKHEVNKLVGNPVNLIDVHNEIGREYMNALLDAMKKSVGGGAPGSQESAMKRLEAAFAAVQETMDVHAKKTTEEKPVDKNESSVQKTAAAAESAPTVPAKSDFSHSEGAVSEEALIKQNSVAKSVEGAAQQAVPPVGTADESESKPTAALSSVAKEKQVQDMMISQKREAATTDKQREDAEIAAMDPLMTPEVSSGLNQLLSEWNMFKHSGLFGTGPSGADHPLYKKLSVVPMAAVVAGRFEGVTPQIKRSITDYMNGWRYEEGILHEQGESFEHYLRRVIKHILSKRTGA